MNRWIAAVLLGATGCGAEPAAELHVPLGQRELAFVNGEDDRLEYFELAEPFQRAALEEFSVVLMTEGAARAVASGHVGLLPTWGQVNRLCSGEPFTEQPSAAFCSGVLVDWNLVLTSGHCVDAVPLDGLRVVFDYYYQSAGELAATEDDAYRVARVVTARRDEPSPGGDEERLDYAWLELAEPARAPHRPAATYTLAPGARENEPVISIGSGGGVPLKWDGGGRVQNTRAEYEDYFIADTDTSQGSSGGGVFDENLAVLGSLARGASDFVRSGAGCYVTNTESDPRRALEQFTYVHRAVEGLCATGFASPLCDPACEQPCDAAEHVSGPGPVPVAALDAADAGCALGRGTRGAPLSLLGAALAALGLAARRGRQERPRCRTRGARRGSRGTSRGPRP